MTTLLNFGRDEQGYNANAPSPATDLQSATITSGSHSRFQVPSNYANWIVSFSFGASPDCWVAYGGSTITAAPPAGATFASTNSELNPGSRRVSSGSYIDVYNNGSSSVDVGISMYAVSQP